MSATAAMLLGAVIGFPLGYLLGWLTDSRALPRCLAAALYGMWVLDAEGIVMQSILDAELNAMRGRS
jgi:NhaP-type Na+/H+ or K+/H+ antiporter